MYNNIITTVEELKGIVSDGGKIITSQYSPKGYKQKLTVQGGRVDMSHVVIQGMCIEFLGCSVQSLWNIGKFTMCEITMQDTVADYIRSEDSTLSIEGSEMRFLSVNGGTLYLGDGNTLFYSRVSPATLHASPRNVLELFRIRGNTLSSRDMVISSATASVNDFGTYNGSVHYFKEEGGKVIAGCWQGTLSEFKEKAQERGVSKNKYEAVYNYFKSFN